MSQLSRSCPRFIRGILAVCAAIAIVALSTSPVAAAPEDGSTTPANPPTNATPPTGDVGSPRVSGTAGGDQKGSQSRIADQCDPEAEVPEEAQGWQGFFPAWTGCGAIASLDWTLRKLGMLAPLDIAAKGVSGAQNMTTIELLNGTGRNNENWFGNQTEMLRVVVLWTIPPIYLIAVMHAVFQGKLERLLKITLVFFPISVLGTWVGMVFVQQSLYITDDIAAVFQQSISADTEQFMVNVAYGFGPEGFMAKSAIWLLGVFMAFGLMFAAIVIYIVLSLREASIYLASLFLPVGFAMLIWPPLQKYFKKLVEFLFGMIICKIVMVGAVSLMVASMATVVNLDSVPANSLGLDGNPAAADPQRELSFFSWLTQTLTVLFTFAVVCFAPNLPSKLFSNVNFEETGALQATWQSRPDMKRKIDWTNRMFGVAKAGRGLYSALRGRSYIKSAGARMNNTERMRQAVGLPAVKEPITREDLRAHGFKFYDDPDIERDENGQITPEEMQRVRAAETIMTLASSDNWDDERIARAMLHVRGDRMLGHTINPGNVPAGTPGHGTDPRVFGAGGYAKFDWMDDEGKLRTTMILRGHDKNNNRLAVPNAQVEAQVWNEIYNIRHEAKQTGDTRDRFINVVMPIDVSLGGKNLNALMDLSDDEPATFAKLNENQRQVFGAGDRRFGDYQSAQKARKSFDEINKRLKALKEEDDDTPRIIVSLTNTAYGTGVYNGNYRPPVYKPVPRR